jgi:hypothetical protein
MNRPLPSQPVGYFFSLIWTRPQKLCGAADNKFKYAMEPKAISVIIAV